MVLSNKKLKQKLRASMAESLAASEAQHYTTNKNSADKEHPNSQTHQSFKSLLDSETQKPRFSKREKRRKTLSLQGPETVGVSDSGGTKEENEKGASEVGGGKKNKKKRKRKREEGLDSGVVESTENVAGKKAKKIKEKKKKREEGLDSGVVESKENIAGKKAKKKKKKTKKKKKAAAAKTEANEEVKKGVEGADGGNEEQDLTEVVKTSDSQQNGDVSTKVYVGGIPYYSTEDDIRSYFDGCGTITEVDCMKFPETGKFRGIAIISFKTEAAAKRALALDGADMGGLFLKIQPYKSTKANKVSDFAPAIVEGYNRIYVGNLSWDITEEDLRKLFSDCSISSIRFGEDKETQEFRGYAHIDFADSLSLSMALNLDQKIVCGRPVRIRCAVPKKVPETNTKPMSISNEAENSEVNTVSGKIRRRTCYECGEKGHLSSSCPKKQTTDLTNPGAS
ncbi:hypothetical protein F0562_026115 [Nyssa sinensis]|uniref:CCHC-type domain-containing protein n=1 Tax=Nyssa sinensis TaxID=561372 RepID=A0A5J5B854_9ASTE|nr:hypothetical protein F0562_026115 [Nyssa sinensis]